MGVCGFLIAILRFKMKKAFGQFLRFRPKLRLINESALYLQNYDISFAFH